MVFQGRRAQNLKHYLKISLAAQIFVAMMSETLSTMCYLLEMLRIIAGQSDLRSHFTLKYFVVHCDP